MIAPWIILSFLLLSALAGSLQKLCPKAAPWLLAAGPGLAALWLLAQMPGVSAGAAPAFSAPWVPELGLELAFRLDGLGLLLGLLVCGIGFFIVLYGSAYFEKEPVARGRFFTLILVFMAAMFGLAVADDLLLFFLFWELTSITSYLLIGFKHKEESAREAAQQALIITAGGGLALLAGLILLGDAAGTLKISELAARAELVKAHALYPWILGLVFLGAATKSAQWPFHFWLPGAMAAPTPVSAYLHSATMVKAGVFLLARLFPVLGGTELWQNLLGLAGAVTMVTASVLALGQRDLKRLLAYTTVSALGTLVMLLGIGDALSLQAAVVFLLVHAFYKGALFMVAGAVDHATGTRDINLLQGLRHLMPWTAAGAVLAAFSMSGIPPFIGFVAKELLYEAKVSVPDLRTPLLIAAVFANMATVKVAFSVGLSPFHGAPPEELEHAHDAGWRMKLGFLTLGVLSLVCGLAPQMVNDLLLAPALRALDPEAAVLKLKLWHGFTPVLALSVVTVAGGIAMHLVRRPFQKIRARFAGVAEYGPGALYQWKWSLLLAVADGIQRWIQNGRLRHYLRVIFILTTGLLLLRVLPVLPELARGTELAPRGFETTVVVTMALAGLVAALTRSRITALLGLGWVGLGVTYIFVDFGAPDLALTLILVEALTVVLFAVVITRLPPIRPRDPLSGRLRDAGIALLAGAAAGMVVWKAAHVRLHESISPEFMARSLSEANGRNVVNVILVDFRALDTLGEIMVLGVAALGVYALVRMRSAREDELGADKQEKEDVS
ncbi:MAG TPA: proton-conducting transporter membrane subunit [Prosthecobacter sp.]|nr:proton-conducting transporter membrane subunit [Prosthecobacter sp.]HRK15328.1 proton-conducting transporter membrane subunit [Prosthecobacter sp.]